MPAEKAKVEGIKVERVDGKIIADVTTDVVTATAMIAVIAKKVSDIAGIAPEKILQSASEALLAKKAREPEFIKLRFEI